MKFIPEKKMIVLSRRNLEALLAKLDGHPPNSKCTIGNDGWLVKAEENDPHYADLGRDPGLMHPDTEIKLNEKINSEN